ncbi:hypothetical protein [Chitinophaga sp. 22620]|uniref:hypothetical protein n=1 Tax=Chitinophaga sp. 22620 TaxID=3453952 RepID=UPI003F84F370
MKRYIAFLLIAFIAFSACRKQEALFNFIERAEKPQQPKPPVVEPPALSEDFKNVELVYNGDTIKTSMIGRKVFGETKQPNGTYASEFELAMRLDNNSEIIGFQNLRIKLPLGDSGQVKTGKYIIENNEIKEGGLLDIKYIKGVFADVFEDAAFSTDKDRFSFSISMRIEGFNAVKHTIEGVIDSMTIYKLADTSKHITIRNAGFNFYFDFLEVYLNDTLTYETATTDYSMWYPTEYSPVENIALISGERLYPVAAEVPIKAPLLTFVVYFGNDADTIHQETIYPLSMFSTTLFLLSSSEYVPINDRALLGISPKGAYQCRFINATQLSIAGGIEVTSDKCGMALDEYYDAGGTYQPAEFLPDREYKLRCAFYQRKF